MNLPTYNHGTPAATEAIKNAITQHEFYTNKKAFGPAYDESERRRNALIFADNHKSFSIKRGFDYIEICTHYKETKKSLSYFMRVFINNELADIQLLKQLLRNGKGNN